VHAPVWSTRRLCHASSTLALMSLLQAHYHGYGRRLQPQQQWMTAVIVVARSLAAGSYRLIESCTLLCRWLTFRPVYLHATSQAASTTRPNGSQVHRVSGGETTALAWPTRQGHDDRNTWHYGHAACCRQLRGYAWPARLKMRLRRGTARRYNSVEIFTDWVQAMRIIYE